ncbi:hypothetical protein B0H10DRAFT_1964858 [Mycena sp. CBHHK59/15]|nr:hypothetical protein B0H10DRAFT_1964858 [Mycena sp. CBHHK59/15]
MNPSPARPGSGLERASGLGLDKFKLKPMLYGMGVLQTWIYFVGHPTDPVSVKWTVLVVLCDLSFPRSVYRTLETIQVVFFSGRRTFVSWSVSGKFNRSNLLQLLAAYLSAFTVQL